MTKIPAIISKNLKILLRSRVSALIIIFGPLLLTLLVGLAFSNTSLSSINVGVYSPEYNELVNSFINKTEEARLIVTRFESEAECADSIKYGTINLCMVFGRNFQIGSSATSGGNSTASINTSNLITFYVDPSQMNLVYGVIDLITSQVDIRREELSTELTDVILNTLDDARLRIISDESIYTELIKANLQVKTKGESITSKLGSMDLNFNKSSFATSNLTRLYSNLTTRVEGNISMKLRLNQSLVLLDRIRDDVNGTSAEDDLEIIIGKVQSVHEDAKVIDDSLLSPLGGAISRLNSELESTSAKFTQLKANRDSIVTTDLKEISTSVDNILTQVMQLKSSSDATKRDIDAIPIKDASSIVSPIRTQIKPLVSETYLNYMFPSLISLVIMLVTLLFAQTIVMMERKSPSFFRNLVTPTSDGVFILSNFLTTLILLTLQVFLIMGVSSLVFKVDIMANLSPTIVVLFLIITLYTLIGIIIGTLFSSPETSTLAAVSVGSIMLFLSDVILPLESMPSYIQQIARFNPFVIGEHLLRNTIIFKSPLSKIGTEKYAVGNVPGIYVLLIYVIIVLVFLVIIHMLTTRVAFKKKTAPKKLKKGQIPLENEDIAGDPVEKIETLLTTAYELLKQKEYSKVRVTYVHLNELYTRLPAEKKKEYFKKIVKIHNELDKQQGSEDKKSKSKEPVKSKK